MVYKSNVFKVIANGYITRNITLAASNVFLSQCFLTTVNPCYNSFLLKMLSLSTCAIVKIFNKMIDMQEKHRFIHRTYVSDIFYNCLNEAIPTNI